MTQADGAVLGATIHTLDSRRPVASAVAWRDGVIVAVGADDEVRALVGSGTDVVDGHGLTVTPGMVDGHLHPFLGTDSTRGVDLRGADTIEEVRSRLAAGAAELPADGWLLGHSLSYDVFSGSGIHASLVDAAAGGRPLHLRFFDGHTDLANAAALARAGVDGPRAFTSASEIVCDPDGTPTGELRELAAMQVVRDVIPAPSDAQRLDAYAQTLRAMNRVGLTGAHVMSGGRALLADVAALEARGDLTMRLAMPLRFEPETDDTEVEARLPLAGTGGRRWTVRIAKFFLDGVIEAGTAWLVDPGPGGVNHAPFWADHARYSTLVEQCTTAGFVCVSHAVGDGAVRAALDAYAHAGAPARGMHRVEHIETLLDEDLPRFTAEGVAASMQPQHIDGIDNDEPCAWRQHLHPDRIARGFRTRDLHDSGATLVLGSDWMVADYDPRHGMAWAELRRRPGAPDRTPYHPHQALDRHTILHGYTTAPAHVLGDQAVAGTITEGRHADLTAWHADPLTTPADDLPDVPIALTVVDGEILHR